MIAAASVGGPASPSTGTIDGARRLTAEDIPALVHLARIALPDTMAARLGDRFAHRYFVALLAQNDVIVDGYFLEGELVGFIIYTADVAAALQAVFRKHAAAFTWALLPALLSPTRLAYVVRIALAVLAGRGEEGDDIAAELLSIGLLPEVRGRGASPNRLAVPVAHRLVERACSHLAGQRVPAVKVFCKPEEIEPIANRFVQKEEFVARGRVARFGIPATLYVKRLAPRA